MARCGTQALPALVLPGRQRRLPLCLATYQGVRRLAGCALAEPWDGIRVWKQFLPAWLSHVCFRR